MKKNTSHNCKARVVLEKPSCLYCQPDLDALAQRVVLGLMGGQPRAGLDVIAKGVLGNSTATAAASAAYE